MPEFDEVHFAQPAAVMADVDYFQSCLFFDVLVGDSPGVPQDVLVNLEDQLVGLSFEVQAQLLQLPLDLLILWLIFLFDLFFDLPQHVVAGQG